MRSNYRELMDLLGRLEKRLCESEGLRLPAKPGWMRVFLEPVLNLTGCGLGAAVGSLPAAWSYDLQSRILGVLSGGARYPLDPDWEEQWERARLLERRTQELFGTPPAVLCATSHPPVAQEVDVLNFELMRQAYGLIRSLSGAGRAVREVVAIDRFALDAVSFIQEGLYAGTMGTLHLGFDRQPWMRSGVQKMILGHCGYGRFVHRLVRSLRRREAVVMALSGGVYENSRLLYTAREFLVRARKKSGKNARSILEREVEILMLLAGESLGAFPVLEPSPNRSGDLPEPLQKAVEEHLMSLGIGRDHVSRLICEFKEEFRREVPWRVRFFEFLNGRVVRRGTPVLVVPVSHGSHQSPRIRLGSPAALLPGPGSEVASGRETVRCERALDRSGKIERREQPVEDFAKDWVSENFT